MSEGGENEEELNWLETEALVRLQPLSGDLMRFGACLARIQVD